MTPLLPDRETRGTYYVDDHQCVLNGMFYRHARGGAWRDLQYLALVQIYMIRLLVRRLGRLLSHQA